MADPTDAVVARAVLQALAAGEAVEAASARQAAAHLRADAPAGVFRCEHCGTTRHVPEATTVAAWLRESHDFVLRHRGCPAPRAV